MSAVKPLEVNLTGLEGSVREGTAVVVYCVARGARPAATISWLNDSSALDKNAVETTLLQVIAISFNIAHQHTHTRARAHTHTFNTIIINEKNCD